MIGALFYFPCLFRYGVRGALKPPLGPHNTPWKRWRYLCWAIDNRIYHSTGLPRRWRRWSQLQTRGFRLEK
jgi:hypothetical protein